MYMYCATSESVKHLKLFILLFYLLYIYYPY